MDKSTQGADQRKLDEFIDDIKVLLQEIQQLYCQDSIPWVVGYSGGKDSTAVMQLVWHAVASLPEEKRTKNIHVITTDTLVENPVVSAWVRRSLNLMKNAAEEQDLPIIPVLLKPEIKDTYWVN
jgi:DNA sulfur modification protein DndC